MLEVRDIGDLPDAVIRRRGPFSALTPMPEWSFWYYVIPKTDLADPLTVAAETGRYFVENYAPYTVGPQPYLELEKRYKLEWWKHVVGQRRTEDRDWSRVDFSRELKSLLPESISMRKKGCFVQLYPTDSSAKVAHAKFDFGRGVTAMGLSFWHSLTGRAYMPQSFFGFRGIGQLPLWSPENTKWKLRLAVEFCDVFLPIFSRCSEAKPPVPYDELARAAGLPDPNDPRVKEALLRRRRGGSSIP